MTRKQFLRIFRERVAPLFIWNDYDHVWGWQRYDPDANNFCPIDAVYKYKYGKIEKTLSKVREHGRKLGLSNEDIKVIMDAADLVNPNSRHDDLDYKTKRVQQSLLRATGR